MKHPTPALLAALSVLAATVVTMPHAQTEAPWASNEQTAFTPEIHHPNIATVTLFAQHPEIVTPVGIAVAPDGRVFVQENHTHKRNSDYQGPETDRILIFEDTDNDGVADKRSVFYEGHTFSTDLLFGPDGHLYVSTRWFVGRFRDAAVKKKADGEPEKLVICETDGDYPHNGVGGLAIDPANPDRLAFGFGENLGADYTFVGSDGVKLSGGAEGGSTYRCRTDGSRLTRQSTGHWNAFGMAYDLDGNLFSTDNDPNATPPNRLLHIIPGADFGYEYRYGRSGRHPLVCWYGEHPGTLGMIGALGEAACGVIAHGPGQLLSASWTDNRIDLHSLEANGDSFVATRDAFLSGPDDFRPVHFSYSADGKSLYFTDWVKLSYPVHGHGRIWCVKFKQPVRLEPLPRDTRPNRLSPEDALKHLGSDDPYVRTEAIDVLTKAPEVLLSYTLQPDADSVARAHYAVALKRLDAGLGTSGRHTGIIPSLLADLDQDVRFVGIKWIADEDLSQYRPNLEQLLSSNQLGRRDLQAVMAALAKISGDTKSEFSPDEKLLELAVDAGKPSALRALALQGVDVNQKRLTVDTLAALTRDQDAALRREAVRSLVIHPDATRTPVLAQLAADPTLDADLRADAIAGLADGAAEQTKLLEALAGDANPTVAAEAHRTLVSAGLATRTQNERPPVEDLKAWQTLLAEATGNADTNVGRRLFFHPRLGGCFKCHTMHGRGRQVGPDLTTIRNQSGITQSWLLKHIVNPNAQMAPFYRPQQLLTVDGKVLTGLVLGKEGKSQAYVGSDGALFYVDKDDIEARRELATSIMPDGLLDRMDATEIRDLIAFLLERDSS
jgi:putative membrane-bound dehydrogenase-like protein